MSREPELPDFIRDLEIELSLEQMSSGKGNAQEKQVNADVTDPTA